MSDSASRPREPLPARAARAAPTAGPSPEIARQIEAVTAPNPQVRAQALTLLPKHGTTAAVAIVQAIRRRANHPEEMPDYVDALAAIGRAAVPAVADALAHIRDASDKDELAAAYHLVDALERIGDRQAAPAIGQLLEQLRNSIPPSAPPDLLESAELVRVKAHTALSEISDPRALGDLLELLGDGRHRVRMGIVQAVARVGDRRALVPLLRLYEVELPVSGASAREVKEAFRAIVRREGVSPDDPLFVQLSSAERATLEKLHPSLKKNGKGPP